MCCTHHYLRKAAQGEAVWRRALLRFAPIPQSVPLKPAFLKQLDEDEDEENGQEEKEGEDEEQKEDRELGEHTCLSEEQRSAGGAGVAVGRQHYYWKSVCAAVHGHLCEARRAQAREEELGQKPQAMNTALQMLTRFWELIPSLLDLGPRVLGDKALQPPSPEGEQRGETVRKKRKPYT